ncbi:MAG: endonuclease III domain-containing protein [Kiritimatiellia bacterium]
MQRKKPLLRANLAAIYRLLVTEYQRRNGPLPPPGRRSPATAFRILVSTILSARTKDDTTAAACQQLFRLIKKPKDLKNFSAGELAQLIYPVGFYRTKARHLKQLPTVLEKQFCGRIPDTIEELCRIPGVGRKTANLVLTDAFGKPAICVDTHVHRISNRLGLVRTNSPLQTELALRRILPRRYWIAWNTLLVSFGQTICRPLAPRCGVCLLFKHCNRVGI